MLNLSSCSFVPRKYRFRDRAEILLFSPAWLPKAGRSEAATEELKRLQKYADELRQARDKALQDLKEEQTKTSRT